MLLGDLLLAIPGLISPISSQARTEEVKASPPTPAAIATARPEVLSVADRIKPLELSLAQSAFVLPESTLSEDAARANPTIRNEDLLLLTKTGKLSQTVSDRVSDTSRLSPQNLQAQQVANDTRQIDDADNLMGSLPARASGKDSGLSFASSTITAPSNSNPVGIAAKSPAPTESELKEGIRQALEQLPDEFRLAEVTEPGGDTGPGTNQPAKPGDDGSDGSENPVVTPPATDNKPDPGTNQPEQPAEPGDDGATENGTDLPARNEAITAEAGRVAIITPEDDGDIASIRILSQGEHGHVSVNPDNSLALVFSEDPGDTGSVNFSYEITYADGSTRTVNTGVELTASQQAAGWSLGDVYMLETDASDSLVIEHGDNHRKVYVTGSDKGLTAADIARLEGINADQINGDWLQKHPEYGGSEDMALSRGPGMALWYGLTSGRQEPSSHWLLLERGYQYDNLDRLVTRGSEGESALHPIVIGAYGIGSAPVVTDTIRIYQADSTHTVIRDLNIDGGLNALEGYNVLLDNLRSTSNEISFQKVDNVTLRNSEIMDVTHDSPVGGSDIWSPHINRMGGLYMAKTTGVLIEGNFFDMNGWQEGYDYNLSGDKPQPPSMYSHNVYLDFSNLDVTFRDNISMRASSFGAQIRSGGFIEDNAFIDNNAAVNFLGGNYRGAGPVGHFTLFMNNVITSAGHKRVSMHEGAVSMGLDDSSIQSSLIGNIIAHMADPNNAAELAEKGVTHNPYKAGINPYYDDTIIYNWASLSAASKQDTNVGITGMDTSLLKNATIQKFAAELLGKDKATIGDLADYLRAQADGKLDKVVDADVINQFFQTAFQMINMAQLVEAQNSTTRFIPDDRGEGMRWDNKLNWSTDAVPDGGDIDLGGNRVLYAAKTTTVDDFVFGNFGQFKVNSGRINIDGEISVGEQGGLLQTSGAGQVWISGYRDSDLLTIHADGGRFANTGAFVGKTQLEITNDSQALLATAGNSFDLKRDSWLSIKSSDAKIGFDGNDGAAAVLRMHDGSTTLFVADSEGIGQIREFRSGAFGENSDVTSGVVLNGTLQINLTAWTQNTKAANVTLIDVDQLTGNFDDIKIMGLDQDRDALVRVNYTNDSVVLVLGDAGKGTGQVRTTATGEANFIDYSKDATLQTLWDALLDDVPSSLNDPL